VFHGAGDWLRPAKRQTRSFLHLSGREPDRPSMRDSYAISSEPSWHLHCKGIVAAIDVDLTCRRKSVLFAGTKLASCNHGPI
jgi:hypothetical protein